MVQDWNEFEIWSLICFQQFRFNKDFNKIWRQIWSFSIGESEWYKAKGILCSKSLFSCPTSKSMKLFNNTFADTLAE